MKYTLLKFLVLFVAVAMQCVPVSAQAVIFPQQQQAGEAVGTSEGTSEGSTYTLKNDLLTATFTKAGDKLTFGGCEQMYLAAGTELFKVTLGNGTVVPASSMTLGTVSLNNLTGNTDAVKGSERVNGKELVANYTYGNLSLVWRAVLRDGSHYLRTELDLTANADQAMTSITPMLYAYNTELGGTAPAIIGNTRGAVLANDKIFAGLETPMGINSVLSAGNEEIARDNWVTTVTESGWIVKKYTYTDDWNTVSSAPSGIGVSASKLKMRSKNVTVSEVGTLTVTLDYTAAAGGNKNYRLNIAGVDVVDASGNVVASDYHTGSTGDTDNDNVYTLNISKSGSYTVRCFADVSSEIITSNGTITYIYSSSSSSQTTLQGYWSRATTLESGKTWNVSAVVGLVAPGQQRRSFLAYSERERAVPWRPYPLYNSWYELNIDRNNDSKPENNMKATQCISVVNDWKLKLYDQYGVAPEVFVWDDGWDNYKTWEFHSNFSNGFKDIAAITNSMSAHQGAWLGPVGGYGVSGDTRRSYWNSNNRGGMKLSNPAYYNCFLSAITNLVNNHDVRFFKFDGISALPSATGPDMSIATGEEDAEGIINIEREARKIKKDLFINTTVGTWASPFWYRFTDATWRQENDYGTIGNGSTDREKWITYRDRLVYQNYVQNSPLCPINTLMTHGVILTEHGKVATNFDYAGVLREIRCAFACGSGMVELYCDRAKLDDINNGALWGDIADCIKWQRDNADVLPDVHWVGGNPWDGSKNNVYGWASWNGEKATLALRNPCTTTQTFTFTLREVLEIPSYFTTALTLTKAFDKDADLKGLTTGEALDLDSRIIVTLDPSSVYVFNGTHGTVVVTPDPSFNLTADEKVTAFGEVTTGETYTRTVKVKGQDLKGVITVASSAKEVLVPAVTTITKAQAEAGYDLSVSLNPTAVAENATATLTFTTEGAEAKTLQFTWTAKAPAVPTLNVSTATTAFGTVTTNEKTTATVTVKAADLKGDITVSSSNTVLKPAVNSIAKADAESATGCLLSVDLLPTTDGTGEATLTFTADGAEAKSLTFSWTAQTPVVVTPSLSVTKSSYDWSNLTVGTSATATLALQGANLNGNVTVASDNAALVPSATSVSKADAEAGYTLTLTLTPKAAGTGSATVTVKTDGVADQTFDYEWTATAPVVATPVLNVTQNSYDWSDALVNGTGTTTVTVKGENLQGDVSVRSSNSVLTTSVSTITQAQAEAGYTLAVTLKPTKKGSDSGTLTFTTTGVEPQTVTYTWTARNMTFWERIFGKKTFSTAVVPSSVDIPSGFRAFKVNGINNGILTLEEQFNTLEACTPYLLYNYSGNEVKVSGYYDSDNDTITYSLVTEGYLTGAVYNDKSYTFGTTDYVLQDQGAGSMFYKANGFTLAIPKGKCFLRLPTTPSSAPAAFRIVIDGDITGLEAVETDSTDDVIYNMMGMRVTRMIPGNVYVVNGKKVVAQ